MIKKYKIFKFEDDNQEIIVDTVVEEAPLTIFVNGEEYLSLVSSPVREMDLCLGILKTEDLINSYDDILDYEFNENKREIYVKINNIRGKGSLYENRKFLTSGFAPGKSSIPFNSMEQIRNKLENNLRVGIKDIYKFMSEMTAEAGVFKETGGVHSGALYINGKMEVFAEDIGRHNVMNKIVGYAIRNDLNIPEAMVISSGRISSEIVTKLAKTGISLLATRSAPTSAAIEIAKVYNMTLVGFVRGNRASVYTGIERIKS